MTEASLPLFSAYGIELEYMLVDRETLKVRPVADEVMRALVGEYVSDVSRGAIDWSNEIVSHVIELKTAGPRPSLAGAAADFGASVTEIDALAEAFGARLLPTGMHPTMDPHTETKLWQHDFSVVYAAYDRIHGCKGHGWANLQSCHLNLPFSGDAEFGRLHAGIRAVLPLLPGIAATTPLRDGIVTGFLDTRLEVYRTNQRKTPLAAGRVIPEPAFTRAAYRELILDPIHASIGTLDPDGVLDPEFVNSRGAIARFCRDAIEIRLLDTQECPAADLGIALLVTEVVRALTEERWVGLAELESLAVDPLADLLLDVIRDGERAVVTHAPLLRALGMPEADVSVAEVWTHLADAVLPTAPAGTEDLVAAVRSVIARGPLSRSILGALDATTGEPAAPAQIAEIYGALADCLHDGRLFTG